MKIPPEVKERRRVMRKRNAIYARLSAKLDRIKKVARAKRLKAEAEAEEALKEIGEKLHRAMP